MSRTEPSRAYLRQAMLLSYSAVMMSAAAMTIAESVVITHQGQLVMGNTSSESRCPQIEFAASELHKAVSESVKSHPSGQNLLLHDTWHISFNIGRPDLVLHPEGYTITTFSDQQLVEVDGGGTVGAMYGGLRVAEFIRHSAIQNAGDTSANVLFLIPNTTVTAPTLEWRGLKMNVPLDARTPSYGDAGDSAQHNIATMWDLSFWSKHLDNMALHQYNLLSLWSLDPWPSLVDFAGTEYEGMSLDDIYRADIDWVAKNKESFSCNDLVDENVLSNLKLVKKMSISEKISFWQNVTNMAEDRGIKMMIVTWNVFVFPILNNETKFGLNISQTNTETISWVRKSVNLTFATYPKLAAIATDPGERMTNLKGNFSKEEWVWRTYGLGVMDALTAQPERNITVMIRQNAANIDQIINDFNALEGRIHEFQLGYKYAHNAHMYGTTHPPYANEDVLPHLKNGVKALWNLRNDDIFNFRWGSPEYTAQYYAAMPLNVTSGMHMGSDGYVWARIWENKTDVVPDGLEISKHWYNFMMWGRCAYQPCDEEHSMGTEFWVTTLASHFPELTKVDSAAIYLYNGWANASAIIPQVNRLVIGSWINDFQWNPEGCFHRSGSGKSSQDGSGFVDVLAFASYTPVEGCQIVSMNDYVKSVVKGKTINGTSPVQVSQNLENLAKSTDSAVSWIRTGMKFISSELDATLTDMSTFAALGRYYALKLCGSTGISLYKATKNQVYKQQAIECLQYASTNWSSYVSLATTQYTYPQLLGRVGLLDIENFKSDVLADIKIAQNA